jgi:hypothetical protein
MGRERPVSDLSPDRPPPPFDRVDEWGQESFPASDPPSGWAGHDHASRTTPARADPGPTHAVAPAQPSGSRSPWPHSRLEAEIQDVVSALRAYGVLSRPRLAQVCGASHWSDPGFRHALEQAISAGKIHPLGDDLYEIVEPSPPLGPS